MMHEYSGNLKCYIRVCCLA